MTEAAVGASGVMFRLSQKPVRNSPARSRERKVPSIVMRAGSGAPEHVHRHAALHELAPGHLAVDHVEGETQRGVEVQPEGVVAEVADDVDMMNEAIVEHASAKQFIAQIGRMQADDDLYDAMVTVLGEYVNHHIQEEENEMFKQARHSKVDLHMLADTLDQRRTQLQEEMGMQQEAQEQERASKNKNLH